MPNHRQPVWQKRLKGSLRAERERERLLRETRRAETLEFVSTIVSWFMGGNIPDKDMWVAFALENDTHQLATRLWSAYKTDFKAEYKKRHPKQREPDFWRRFKGVSS